MNTLLLPVVHQAFFGGVAAMGFAVLFNCKPSMLPLCFGAGVLALATRTTAQEAGFTLPVASFFAALLLATADRIWRNSQSLRGSVLAVTGAIPLVPGGVAAKVLISCFAVLHSAPLEAAESVATTWTNVMILFFTLAAIGTALALPYLIQPIEQRKNRSIQ